MLKSAAVLAAMTLLATSAMADPVVDEDKVKAISDEFARAFEQKDSSVIEKYMYPGSVIVIDVDPAKGRGEKKISYADYVKLSKMSMQMFTRVEVFNELIKVTVNRHRNQATIKEKTTTVVEMKGKKNQDVSLNTTTFGVVNGQIKVLFTGSTLISSRPVY